MEKSRFNFIFRKRGELGIIFFLPALVAFCLSRPLWNPSGLLNFLIDAAGWLCWVCYVLFRLWATLYIGGQKDVQLQTQGPYSIVRNPLYLGSFFLGLSFAFFLKSFILLVITCIVSLIYSKRVVKIEETFLERKFGDDFRAYRRRTPRFLPDFRLYHADDFIPVELTALKCEARRLLASALIPLGAQVLMWLRTNPGLPHPFLLP